jgi:hypothetical protein
MWGCHGDSQRASIFTNNTLDYNPSPAISEKLMKNPQIGDNCGLTMTSHLVIIEVLVLGLIEKDTNFVEIFKPKDT